MWRKGFLVDKYGRPYSEKPVQKTSTFSPEDYMKEYDRLLKKIFGVK